MGRKKLPSDIVYNIPDHFKEYGTWDYMQNLPKDDPKMFSLFVNIHGLSAAKQRKFDSYTPVKNYFNYIKYHTEEYKQLSIQFDSFKNSNPWVIDFYNLCLSRASYVVDPFDTEGHWVSLQSQYSQADKEKAARALAWFNEKLDFHRFNIICGNSDNALLYYNEIKRDIPFVVGNIVRLRKKYINSRYHDPFYWKRELKDEERVGHITAVLNDTHNNSYNGKGSRLVEVYWAASGEVNKQSIGSLKLFDQKNNKMVDKIVDE